MANINKNTKSFDVLIATVLYIRLFLSLLPAASFWIPQSLRMVSIVLLFLLVILADRDTFSRSLPTALKIFLVPIITATVAIFKGGDLITSLYNVFQVIIWLFVISYVLNNWDNKHIKWLFVIVVVCYLFTLATTLTGYIIFPETRHIGHGGFMEEEAQLVEQFSRFNISGFAFIYSIILFIPCLLYLLKSDYKGKFVLLLLIAGIEYFIYLSEYTTALLLSIVSLTLIFYQGRLTVSRILGITIVLGVFILFGRAMLASFFNNAESGYYSDRVGQRLGELGYLLGGNLQANDGTDLGSRLYLWGQSLSGFLNHPLGGGKIGGHSMVLDTMGQYGIWGLIAMIISYKTVFNTYIKPYKDEMFYGYISFAFIMNIVEGILNPLNDYVFFTLFIPLFSWWLMSKQQNVLK